MTADLTTLVQAAVGFTLATAGAIKFLDSAPLRTFLKALGVRSAQAGLLARAIPPVECVVGLLLLTGVSAWPAAVLLLLFSVALLRAHQRGVEEACHCFGALDPDHRSILALVRSSLLTVGAFAVEIAQGGRIMPVSPNDILSRQWGSTLAGILAGTASIGCFTLLQQVASFERRRSRALLRKGAVSFDQSA